MTACGTVCWTAPEVLRNEKYSFSCDIFSFGICLWEMTSRQDPFPGRAQFQVVIDVGSKGLRPIIIKDCDPFFSYLIEKCWNEDPVARPTFDQIIEELEAETYLILNPYPIIDKNIKKRRKNN